jgi:hypothetical protein
LYFCNGSEQAIREKKVTKDRLNREDISSTVSQLKDHTFKFKSYDITSTNRVLISQTLNSSKHFKSLGQPLSSLCVSNLNSRDRTVLQVMSMVLEALYEPNFSNKLYGTSSKFSVHSA